MPTKIAETYQVAYQAAITRGLDPLAAKVEALDAVAATPEGEAYIEKVIGELKDIAEGAGKPIESLTAEEIDAAMAEWDGEQPTEAVDIVSDEVLDAIARGETSIEKILGLEPEAEPQAEAKPAPRFLISEEAYQAALESLKGKLGDLHAGIDPTVLKERRRWINCGEISMLTPGIDNQQATDLRHGWAERALDLLAEQKPSDAARLAREWNAITQSERKREEDRRRIRGHMIALLQVAGLIALVAWIAMVSWVLLPGFISLIPPVLTALLIYGWLTDKFKKRLNRRNEA